MERDHLQNMGRLSDRIYNIIRNDILSGNLRPGQHLALEEIARNLGVSTTPVRDALSLLAADGLVDWRPRRGAYVAHLTPKAVEELYQLREFIECAAVDFAIAQGPTVATQMKDLALQIDSAHIAGDIPSALLRAHLELRFHTLLVESVGNSRLLAIYRSLGSIMAIAFTLYPIGGSRSAMTQAEHQAIVDAIAAGDAQAARDAARAHLHGAKAGLVAHLRDRYPSG